jgi:hypothetical protein
LSEILLPLNLALDCGNLSGESFITEELDGAELSPNQRTPIDGE